MKDYIKIIEDIYSKYTPYHWVFKELPWYKRPFTINCFLTLSVGMITVVLLITYGEPLVLIAFAFLQSIISLSVIGYGNHLKSKKANLIIPKKGFFRRFQYTRYAEKKDKQIHKELINQKILFGNFRDVDRIKVLLELLSFYENKEKKEYFLKALAKSCFTIILVLLGVYGAEFIGDSNDFMENSKLMLVLVLLLLSVVLVAFFLDDMVVYIMNIGHKKRKALIVSLASIKANIELKHLRSERKGKRTHKSKQQRKIF
ncbi:MAG: hypothetical protein AAF348_19250 [Bacteroidota bacterium]